jgi:hypothetical protein
MCGQLIRLKDWMPDFAAETCTVDPDHHTYFHHSPACAIHTFFRNTTCFCLQTPAMQQMDSSPYFPDSSKWREQNRRVDFTERIISMMNRFPTLIENYALLIPSIRSGIRTGARR